VANILTPQQAANALRVETTDARMLDLLPQVDLYIQNATGRNWTQDSAKNPVAISAATMLLVMWFDNPSMIGQEGALSHGLTAALAQLEVDALKYHRHTIVGLTGAGSIALPGANIGDHVVAITGIYGTSGSQVASFETVVSAAGALQQISGGDLSQNIYVVVTKSPAEDVVP
jgi:hypothetical protein